MKLRVYIMLFIGFISCKQPEDKDQIKECFKKCKEAILTNNGKQAANYIDKRTITFYDNIIYYAINYDSIQLNKLSFIEKYFTLFSKHYVNGRILKLMDGNALFEFVINNGFIDKTIWISNEIDSIATSKYYAVVYPKNSKEKSNRDFYFPFYKESGKWKMNLSDFVLALSSYIHITLERQSRDENETILEMLEATNGKKPDNSIWHPIK